METVIIVIHLMVVLALVATVLLQRSEGGALGIGGGGGGGGGFMTGRGTANVLTRTTAILAIFFFLTSMTLTILAGGHGSGGSILDQIRETPTPTAPAEAPAGGSGDGGSVLDQLRQDQPGSPQVPQSQ